MTRQTDTIETVIQHTYECDIVSCGDDCIGGCPSVPYVDPADTVGEAASVEYVDPTEAGNAARAALAATSTRDLMTKAFALTHQMHGLPEGHSAARAKFRSMRDMIEAEVLRRTGDAS